MSAASSSSSTAAVISDFADLFLKDLALAEWEPHFEETIKTLGNSGALCVIPSRALPVDYPKFVKLLFLVRHPSQGLVGFQITDFNAEAQVFFAKSLQTAPIEISFAGSMLAKIPFVARQRLPELLEKFNSGLLPLREVTGLSSCASQDGGMNFAVSSLSEAYYEFHVAPEVLPKVAVHSEGEVRHGPSDPTKTGPIKEIPRAVGEVLFAGMKVRPDMFAMNRAFTHFYSAMASNQWELPGEEVSRIKDARLHVAIPKSAAIMLLNACWISLGHFRTEEDDQRVADAYSMAAPSLSELRILNATAALEAWSNCGDVLDRLFLRTAEFKSAWLQVSTDMSEVIRCSHQFADMRSNGAVYDILDQLGLRLFQHLSNPIISVAQVRLALTSFRICPEDRWFVAIYEAAQRRFVALPQPLSLITGGKRAAPEADSSVVRHPPGDKKTPRCFRFFSSHGCSHARCGFSHKRPDAKTAKDLREKLQKRGWEVDASKL
jgi:hypothetical protein